MRCKVRDLVVILRCQCDEYRGRIGLVTGTASAELIYRPSTNQMVWAADLDWIVRVPGIVLPLYAYDRNLMPISDGGLTIQEVASEDLDQAEPVRVPEKAGSGRELGLDMLGWL